jgi:multidrug resistance efflux pump
MSPQNLFFLRKKADKTTLVMLIISLFALGLTNCSLQNSTPVTTQATISPVSMSQPSNGSISANGVLLPNRQLLLSFGAGGLVDSIAVGLGETVQAGETLLQLDTTQAQMAVDKAEIELATAQKNYDLIESNLPVNHNAAMAAVLLELMTAQQDLERLYSNADIARVAAFNDMVAAEQAVGEAKYQLYYFTIPATLKGNDPIKALELAKEKLDLARQAYKPYKNQPEEIGFSSTKNPTAINQHQRDLKEQLDSAQGDYNAVLRWFELEAAFTEAQVRLAGAELEYEQLQNGPDPDEVALADARVANAQAQLDLVRAESHTAEQLLLAKSQTESARAELKAAQTQIGQLTLRAPTDGVISAIHIAEGEWVVPGAVVLEMLDLSSWLVETKNVGELQIGQIKTGQGAQVRFNAFQGEVVPGQVIAISPQAVVQQGDTTYTLVIALESTDLNLRSGMTARVEIIID